MRIVLGFLHADEGTVMWNDREARAWPRRTWGYMPEERGLYLRMPVLEQLEFYGSLYGMSRTRAHDLARDWLERFRISEYADRRAESLSKGNQQKIQFIATVLHDPDVILMDEPFGALDEMTRERMNSEVLRIWQQTGTTIVFVTHSIREAVYLADRIVILTKGPATVLSEVRIPIARPRIYEDPALTELEASIVASVMREWGFGNGTDPQ